MQPQTGFYSGDNLAILGTVKLNVKYKSDVNQELTFYVAKTNQPGLLCFGSSQVVMTAKKEQEETTPDDSDQTACTKISQELKEEVIQKYTQEFTGLGWLQKLDYIEMDPKGTPLVNPP